MKKFSYSAAAHKARRAGVALAGFQFLVCAHTALAQATPPASAAADQAPSEAARRAAMSPYRFILQNANAPARKPAPTAAAEAKRQAAPASADQSAAALSRPAPAATAPSPASTPAAPPPPVEQPVAQPVAALAPKPAEPPPRRQIIPVKTDEPRLPPSVQRERPSGVVKVHFDIRPDGSTADVKVLASTNRALNRPTVDAVAGWKFEPVDEVLTVETEVVYKFD